MKSTQLTHNKIVLTARLLLGLIFLVFGLNGFFHFMPQPTMPKSAIQFFGALAASGYMLPLIFSLQLLVGIFLLAGIFVPLALVLLMPITVNIIAFHLALDPAGIVPGTIAVLLQLYLLYAYLPHYKPLLSLKGSTAETYINR